MLELFAASFTFDPLSYKNDKKSDYLLVDIERNNNVNNPIDHEEDIKRLKQEYNNEDIVGILEIENSNYVVPILQADDNEYYLNHDAYGKDNYMGAIYLDFRVDIDSSRKLLILVIILPMSICLLKYLKNTMMKNIIIIINI